MSEPISPTPVDETNTVETVSESEKTTDNTALPQEPEIVEKPAAKAPGRFDKTFEEKADHVSFSLLPHFWII